ncbi:MAG: chromate efflux transporter [Nocardioidaceae bacterium]|nr:chromate efflux transporter [Nocardioidaceae bacterium]MCL2615165.1 chromate efflux transporter [Nocardioidaceae bacterium]
MAGPADATDTARRHPGTPGEVFRAFLRLGLTSFGGPVAHLGYFREAFVVRRRWLTEKAYADVVGLCQFLPGPASSQVGMALGLQRAGYLGLLAAWVGFTLPSAVLLVAFGYAVSRYGDISGAGWIDGLKAAAVAVVAQAVLGMARTLTPDRRRATIAAAAAITALLVGSPLVQVGVIVATGVVGLLFLRDLAEPAGPADPPDTDDGDVPAFTVRVSRAVSVIALASYGALLVVLPLVASVDVLHLFGVFYRAGALVFGGGHVVLPLLQAQVVGHGMVGHDDFLAGYGAAQAVPGPLFTFSAFLGTVDRGSPSGVEGAAVALLGIFLPAGLAIVGALPFWQSLRHSATARCALMGVNAGVVGLLAAALYDPVFTEGIPSVRALAVAIAAFVALTQWRVPSWAVVVVAALVGAVVL